MESRLFICNWPSRTSPCEIPYKTMHSTSFLEDFGLREPTLRHGKKRVLLGFFVFRGEAAHQLLLRIEDFQPHGGSRRLKKVVNHCASRRIFSRRFFGRKRRPYKCVIIYADGRSGMVKPGTPSCFDGLGRLAEWGDVVENPEGATVRRDYQVIAVDREIANGTDRQIQLQRLPLVPVVERHVDTQFSTGEEQSSSPRVLANGPQEIRSRNAARDQLPGGGIVMRSIDIWCLIIEATPINNRVSEGRIKMGSFDQRNLAPFAKALRCDILPGFAAIAAEMNQSRIAPRPDQFTVEG